MNSENNEKNSCVVTCPICHESYDACEAKWCECVTQNPTLVCPNCGKCFCDAPAAIRAAFWENAPGSILQKRMKQEYGREVPRFLPNGNPIRRPLVMVVDDDENTLNVAFHILEALGYGSLLSDNGTEALELAKRFKPDIVLTDHMMPGLKGSELCKLLKEDPNTKNIPVIIMTSLYNKKDRERINFLKKYGADDFLNKPIPYDRLKVIIGSWLEPLPAN